MRSPSSRRSSNHPIFEGLLAASITPYHSDGTVNFEAIGPYGRMLKADGVQGVFLNGTTGESMFLSMKERKGILEHYLRDTDLKVCVHIGAQSLPETVDLARHAEHVGAHAASIMIPSLFKPQTVGNVVDYLEEVSRAVPNLAITLYHFPMLTNTSFRLFDIFSLIKSRGTMPNFHGAKFTSPDLGDFALCLAMKGQFTELFYATEPNLCGAALLGARAYVGRDFSTVGPLYLQIHKAASTGDVERVRTLQAHSVRYLQMLHEAGANNVEKGIAATKVLVSDKLGIDCGSPRLPIGATSHAEVALLRSRMKELSVAMNRDLN